MAKGPHAGSCYAVIITTLMFGGLGIPVERSLRWFSPKLQVAAEKLDEAGRSSPRALKRNTFSMTYGAAEAAPLQSKVKT